MKKHWHITGGHGVSITNANAAQVSLLSYFPISSLLKFFIFQIGDPKIPRPLWLRPWEEVIKYGSGSIVFFTFSTLKDRAYF